MTDIAAFTSFERDGWNRVPEGYHDGLGSLTARAADPLLDAVGIEAHDHVLDVATGPGYLASRALTRGADVTGVDLAPNLLDLARRLVPDADLQVADAAQLPFPDASFDAVVAGFLLPHLADPEAAVAELARVVRAGGVVGLSTWGPLEQVPVLGVMVTATGDVGLETPPEVPAGPAFFRYSDPAALAALLEGAGLERLEIRAPTLYYRADSSASLWDAILGGTVRTAARLRAASAADRARVRQRFDELVAEFAVGGALELPVTVLLATGRSLT